MKTIVVGILLLGTTVSYAQSSGTSQACERLATLLLPSERPAR